MPVRCRPTVRRRWPAGRSGTVVKVGDKPVGTFDMAAAIRPHNARPHYHLNAGMATHVVTVNVAQTQRFTDKG